MPTKTWADKGWLVLLLVAGVIAIQAVSGVVLVALIEKPTDRGNFGEMFGVVNTLFSGLALGGVVVAILLQREELRLQREELKLTREELARSAEAQQRSAELLQKQLNLTQDERKVAAERRLKELAPLFKTENRSVSGGKLDLVLLNYGNAIRDLEIVDPKDCSVSLLYPEVVGQGDKLKLDTTLQGNKQEIGFTLSFTDLDGNRRRIRIEYNTGTTRFTQVEI